MGGRSAWALLLFAFLTTGLLPALPVQADHPWADPDMASIRPGVEIGYCTSNFVFTRGTDVFLGLAAHCFSTSGSTETNGCVAGTLELGTTTSIGGSSRPGTLAYSSWITMQGRGEPTSSNECLYNDFALVRLHPDDHSRVNPGMLFFGGPEGIASSATTGAQVITYGNSPLRPGIGVGPFHSHAREGVVVTPVGDGWSYVVYTATPGVPGDSGSGLMTNNGEALGILSTLQLVGFTGANGFTSMDRALDYANQHSGVTYALATATLTNNGLLTP